MIGPLVVMALLWAAVLIGYAMRSPVEYSDQLPADWKPVKGTIVYDGTSTNGPEPR